MPPLRHTLGPAADVDLMLTPRGELVEVARPFDLLDLPAVDVEAHREVMLDAEALDLAEFNRRAQDRRRRRATLAERSAHRRELLEAALLGVALVVLMLLALAFVNAFLSTPSAGASERRGELVGYRAELIRPMPRTPEARLARASAPARELVPSAPAGVPVELGDAEDVVAAAAGAGEALELGAKAGYFTGERIVLDRGKLTTTARAYTILAHELGHAAGLPHVDDPADLMFGGTLTVRRPAGGFPALTGYR